ncbi:14672_t:CDS:2 [Funneliformis caledonium]|uniref:14672_t:CDS:1 n=1 Tax=Funneliformis caledonium TaxID=1117310 RepID=A0A9N9BR90_9GLOM|nr:14672_t:CDS:2 [Funneliformis caledonium]
MANVVIFAIIAIIVPLPNLGRNTHPNGLTEISRSNKIYLLDTRNYTWVGKFELKSITVPTPSNTSLPNTSSTTASTSPKTTADGQKNTIVAAISGIVGTAFVMVIGILGYKWYQKRKQNEIMRIAGDK